MGKNIHTALETQAKHRLMIFQDSFCLSCWLWSVSVHHLQGSIILSHMSSGESLWLESSRQHPSSLYSTATVLSMRSGNSQTNRGFVFKSTLCWSKSKTTAKKNVKYLLSFKCFFYTVIFVDSWVSAFMDITSNDILRKSKVLLHSFKRSVM